MGKLFLNDYKEGKGEICILNAIELDNTNNNIIETFLKYLKQLKGIEDKEYQNYFKSLEFSLSSAQKNQLKLISDKVVKLSNQEMFISLLS